MKKSDKINPSATQTTIQFLGFPMAKRKRKRKRIESGEIVLPEAIIHHIQSFMTGKEAAQTSVLSKHWYSAWSTRPNLDFDNRDFPSRGSKKCDDRLKDFAKKTIQRYEELNLTIESIGLRVDWWQKRRLSHFNELVLNAIQMGSTDLKLHLMDPTTFFSLPKELLGSENLVRLSAIGCTIDLGVNGKVSWSKLKSLSLQRVYFEGDVICDIILSCPLIEELLLSDCFFKVHVSNNVPIRRSRMLILNANLFELRKLKCLSLKKVKIDTSFFCDLSSKFPCLKDLTVDDCSGYKAVQISSPSLERISFVVQKKMLKASFEVPCIRKFTFTGLVLPRLSFGTSSFVWKWESDISITCSGNSHDRLTRSWFVKLKKFLVNLSPSRISLTFSVNINCQDSFRYIQGLAKPPIVDNLRVLIGARSLDSCALLNGLFLSCRPKLISFTGGKADNDFLKLLCERLLGHLRDIKKANVEFYDENLSEWGLPLPLKTLLDGYPENKQSIRLKLIWG
ncbi:hypothetical protein CASFOL_026676 [Castilleja foliolosa]|uniref:F-box/LRR-repeat protein 15/At3g58940/PEG3-like LRR domain-containing protein n=1 Tax=Castilleja foliolosa TaxID=1961234 RepID=A0ABD3CJJ7_9LAMI